MTMLFKRGLMLVALLVALPATAAAAPIVVLDLTVEREIVELVNGVEVTRYVEADSARPGDTLVFTVAYRNKGIDAAADVVFTNPIPEGTRYKLDSANGAGASVTFSTDGGKTFVPAAALEATDTQNRGVILAAHAGPEECTNIRWKVDRIEPGGTGEVRYSAIVR